MTPTHTTDTNAAQGVALGLIAGGLSWFAAAAVIALALAQ